jgi:hypothetical protein
VYSGEHQSHSVHALTSAPVVVAPAGGSPAGAFPEKVSRIN